MRPNRSSSSRWSSALAREPYISNATPAPISCVMEGMSLATRQGTRSSRVWSGIWLAVVTSNCPGERSGSIWASTPAASSALRQRKIRSQLAASWRLPATWMPGNSAASAFSLPSERFAAQTFSSVSTRERNSARTSMPPMLPMPTKPVFIVNPGRKCAFRQSTYYVVQPAGAMRLSGSSENPHLLPHTLQHFQRPLQFFLRMRRGHDGPHPSFAFGDGGKCDAGSQHSFFEQFAGKVHCQTAVTNDDGGDWRFARRSRLAADVESEQAEFFLPEPGVRPELLHPLRFSFENVECRNASRRDRGRMRSRKQKRPRAVIEKIDQIARTADVAAESADRFRQGSNLNVDAPVHPEMIDGAASVAAEHTGSVRVVDHHDCAVFLSRLAQPGQRADVAVHREHAVGDQQLFPRVILHAGELLFGVGDIFVAEDENLRP